MQIVFPKFSLNSFPIFYPEKFIFAFHAVFLNFICQTECHVMYDKLYFTLSTIFIQTFYVKKKFSLMNIFALENKYYDFRNLKIRMFKYSNCRSLWSLYAQPTLYSGKHHLNPYTESNLSDLIWKFTDLTVY